MTTFAPTVTTDPELAMRFGIELVDYAEFEHPNEETPDGSSISDFWDDMHAGFWCDDELNDDDMPFDFDGIPF